MNYSTLGRIQNSERERDTILSNVAGGKFRHRVKLRLAGLTESLRIHYKAMLALEISAHDLKQEHLERIKQLAVLCESDVRICSDKIKQAAFVRPLRRDRKIQADAGDDLRQEFFCAFARFVHNQ